MPNPRAMLILLFVLAVVLPGRLPEPLGLMAVGAVGALGGGDADTGHTVHHCSAM